MQPSPLSISSIVRFENPTLYLSTPCPKLIAIFFPPKFKFSRHGVLGLLCVWFEEVR